MPDQGTSLGTKSVSDMISPETKITTYGSNRAYVEGTLLPVTGYTDMFPGDGDGHFFPIELGEDVTGDNMTLKKNGQIAAGGYPKPLDKSIVIKVGDQSEIWSVEVDGKEVLVLDFSLATLG